VISFFWPLDDDADDNNGLVADVFVSSTLLLLSGVFSLSI